MAVRLLFGKTDDPLFARSKWWGSPDMPEDMEYPAADEGPLTFMCQIRCEEIAPFDPKGLLPHEGMLYFFAALDYALGDLDAISSPGMGEWNPDCFRVLYSPSCDNLRTQRGSEAANLAFPVIEQGGRRDDQCGKTRVLIGGMLEQGNHLQGFS